MANVIIKSDDQRAREDKILHDFGYNPGAADRQAREYAEAAARRTSEALKEMEAHEK